MNAELTRLQQKSDERLADEVERVKSEANESLASQLAAAAEEADRVRAEATREAREVAEAAAGNALQTEIARVRVETERTLSQGLLKLRQEKDERRRHELSEITAQVAQLKDAAAEQAKTAAAEALQDELGRVRQQTLVQERVVRLAPPPVEAAVAPVARIEPTATDDDQEAPSPDSDPDAPQDYYSLWRGGDEAEEAEVAEVTEASANRVRRILFGAGAAACIVLALYLGMAGDPSGDTGYIVIDGPPGAQVWVEGQLIGQTPLPDISAEVGAHEVIVRHPDAGEIRETVTVDTEAPTVLRLSQDDSGDDPPQ